MFCGRAAIEALTLWAMISSPISLLTRRWLRKHTSTGSSLEGCGPYANLAFPGHFFNYESWSSELMAYGSVEIHDCDVQRDSGIKLNDISRFGVLILGIALRILLGVRGYA